MPKFFHSKVIVSFTILAFYLYIFSACDTRSNYDKQQESQKPNVLLIMTDDQGWGDFGVHGNESVNTPVLNKLAKEGIQFDRFFVSPVCAPTRASLLTGRYHLRTGTSWVTHRMEVMREDELTLAELLKSEGYSTGCFGKWHNGEHYPNNALGQGFDEFVGFSTGHWNNYFNTSLDSNGVQIKTSGYISDVLTDASISFITRNKNAPFFCYVPYNAPHGPFQVPDKYFDKYIELGFNDKDACIYGMCENIDENVDKILNTIDSLNLTENTIVVFLTDNGPNGKRYNGGMKGHKGSVDEGGVRVPLFIRYPAKFKRAMLIEENAAHIDILPTIAELCNITIPDTISLDGLSLVPLMEKDNSTNWSDRNIYTHQVHRELHKTPGAIRNDRYRLVYYANKDTLLYDMLLDPGQTNDISGEYPDIVSEMVEDYDDWYKDVTKLFKGKPPIPVGYRIQNVAELPVPESKLFGNLKFKGEMGWANDWIINWNSPKDKVEWNLDVAEEAEFEIFMQYALKEEGIGSEIDINIDGKSISIELMEAQVAEYIPSPDRIPRGEVYGRNWAIISIGKTQISAGLKTLQLNVENMPTKGVFELKSMVLKRIQ